MKCRLRTMCVLVEFVEDKYYASFHNLSYHRYRETQFSILLDIKFLQSQWNVYCRSRVSCLGVCL